MECAAREILGEFGEPFLEETTSVMMGQEASDG